MSTHGGDRKDEGKDNKEVGGANGFLEEKTVDGNPVKPKGWGARHTLAFLGFWAFAVSYAMRFNLSIAIVAMVKSTKSMGVTNVTKFGNVTIVETEEACVHLKTPLGNSSHASTIADSEDEGEFMWDSVEQGIILGSFFWGYVITQLPGGILATKYGGKWTLGLGLFVTAIFAILTPVLARTHVYLLVLARIIQGLGEGVTTPAMHAILAAWAPPDERSFLGSCVYAGCQFGTAVTMIISGYLIHGGVLGGWPSVFYFIGGFSILWFILWVMFMYDTPATHPRISKAERDYIQQSIGSGGGGSNGGESDQIPTPWVEIFKSVPMWAIIVGHVGWISSLPYIVMWIAAIGTTQIADLVIGRKIFRTVTVRKFCQAFGHIGSAIALVLASYSGCDRSLTVLLLTIAVGMNGAIFGGYVVNHVDIAPNFAGILMGITNTFANLTGFAAPYVAGLLINKDPSVQNWQYVFFIAASIYFIDVIVYVLYASGSEQTWNRPKGEHKDTQLEEVKK